MRHATHDRKMHMLDLIFCTLSPRHAAANQHVQRSQQTTFLVLSAGLRRPFEYCFRDFLKKHTRHTRFDTVRSPFESTHRRESFRCLSTLSVSRQILPNLVGTFQHAHQLQFMQQAETSSEDVQQLGRKLAGAGPRH